MPGKIVTGSFIFLLFLFWPGHAPAQQELVSEPILKQVTRLTTQLPVNVEKAYQLKTALNLSLDTLEQMMAKAYPALAEKLNRRSAKLNSFAGYNEENATLLLLPPNQKMAAYFSNEWQKMDALEGAINQAVTSFYGKELYKTKGYVPVWDSVYKRRLPALARYRDGILKLVQAEIAYLKTNGKMFTGTDEEERMQYVEAELSVLQKLILLKTKYKQVVLDDGAEKVTFCVQNPEACYEKKK